MNGDIELLGYKGKIIRVLTRLANPPFSNTDVLLAVVRFEQPYPAAIIETAIPIPPEEYSREEFLEIVKKNGEEQLREDIARHERKKQQRAADGEKTAALKTVAQNIEQMFQEKDS